MNQNGNRVFNRLPIPLVVILLVFPVPVWCAGIAGGKVVWWGDNSVFLPSTQSTQSNGVMEIDMETARDVVSIAAKWTQVLVLRRNGTLIAFGRGVEGGNAIPRGLTNVVSIAVEGSSCWAIKRDGTVSRWGDDGDPLNLVSSLTNIAAITWAGYRSYLALRKDGVVLGFRLWRESDGVRPEPGVRPVKIQGQILGNIVAMASMGYTPLVLNKEGRVLQLGYQIPGKPPVKPIVTGAEDDDRTILIDWGGESSKTPYQYTTADPVKVGGLVLSNVTAISSDWPHGLALTRDRTVVAWNAEGFAESVPNGLTNVIAIAAGEGANLALKGDGTVGAWGVDRFGEQPVPAALTNVVAVAAGRGFGLAVTTGTVPASVFVRQQQLRQRNWPAAR